MRLCPPFAATTPHSFNREDTLERIKRLESEANDCARRMNKIIREGKLPDELVELPFPEEEDEECE